MWRREDQKAWFSHVREVSGLVRWRQEDMFPFMYDWSLIAISRVFSVNTLYLIHTHPHRIRWSFADQRQNQVISWQMEDRVGSSGERLQAWSVDQLTQTGELGDQLTDHKQNQVISWSADWSQAESGDQLIDQKQNQGISWLITSRIRCSADWSQAESGDQLIDHKQSQVIGWQILDWSGVSYQN